MREIIEIVLNVARRLPSLALMLSLAVLGSHAPATVQAASQAAAADEGEKLPPEMARRIEVMVRARSGVPPQYIITVSNRRKSDIPGYDQITVTFSADGNTSKPTSFLLSADGKTLAQFNKFDISADPRAKVSGAGRPSRGGGENAPVLIVGFDDLECPFCSRMHAAMFPAIVDRYKDQVHVVYRDFPLDIHPWAMHAAVDANCLAVGSSPAYWNYVDYVHAHAGEFGGDQHLVAKANESLDKLARDEGERQKVNAPELEACMKKQDDAKIKESVKVGEDLGVEGTPALFINGEKVDGFTPIENVFRMIDAALTAAGQTPPPPYKPPVAPAAPAVKPGS